MTKSTELNDVRRQELPNLVQNCYDGYKSNLRNTFPFHSATVNPLSSKRVSKNVNTTDAVYKNPLDVMIKPLKSKWLRLSWRKTEFENAQLEIQHKFLRKYFWKIILYQPLSSGTSSCYFKTSAYSSVQMPLSKFQKLSLTFACSLDVKSKFYVVKFSSSHF